MRRNFWSKSWSQLFNKGAVHKRRRNFVGRFWYPPSPSQNFDPDLPKFFLLISCNTRIWDAPPPLKTFRRFLWMAPKVMSPICPALIACIFLYICFMKIRFSDEASKSNDAGVLGFVKNRSSWRELIDFDAKTRLKKIMNIWELQTFFTPSKCNLYLKLPFFGNKWLWKVCKVWILVVKTMFEFIILYVRCQRDWDSLYCDIWANSKMKKYNLLHVL